MKAFRTLYFTEMKLSLRGMDMLIFAIAMPIVTIVILGIIFGNKPAFEGASYTFIEQSFGAISAVAICAGGVMGLPLVISDYREKKILKRYKVTPSSPALLLLVQVCIYATYAVVSMLLVWLVSATFFGFRMSSTMPGFFGAFLLVMVCMFSIGTLVGGVAKDSKTAGILASILYFPMLIFSGTTIPYEILPAPLQMFADLMPLTQGIKLMKAASLGLPMENVLLSIMVMLVLSVLCIVLSLRFFKWE